MTAATGRTRAGRRAWTIGALAAVIVGIGVAVSLIRGSNTPAAGDSPAPPPAPDAQGRAGGAALHTYEGGVALCLARRAAPQAAARLTHLAAGGRFGETGCPRAVRGS